MQTRNITVEDYTQVMRILNDWWGGRSMTHLLPRLFFEHFQPTSFAIENNGELVAFIIGFVSQTNPKEAYIHFVGVNPIYRKQGHANDLYQLFFSTVRHLGCNEVRCITTPVNTGSMAFHEAMGFDVQLVKDYAGDGQNRILFTKKI
jgi:ribosomal protein S18 acetylase RimI-like enzyme